MYLNVPIVRGFTEIKVLYDLIKDKNAWICGGYARYMCSQSKKVKPFGDVDIFCKDDESFKLITSAIEAVGITKSHESDVSVMYNPSKNENLPYQWKVLPKINIIKSIDEARVKTSGELSDILDNFDYTIVRIGLISETECLADEHFLEDDNNNYLRIENVHCPVSSILRLAKYIKKGYRTKPIEVLKILSDWDDRGPDYRSKLGDLITKHADHKAGDDTSGLSDEESALLYKMMLID